MPNFDEASPVAIFGWVGTSSAGLTRNATSAVRPERAGDLVERPELVERVERDPDAVLDREAEVGARLRGAVEEEAGRVHAGREGERDLAGAEDVGAGPLGREDPEQGQVAVRLCRVQHLHPVVVGLEGVAVLAVPGPDPLLVGHVERRAVLGRERDRVVPADSEVAVPDREVRRQVHESASIRERASSIRSTGRVRANRT